MDYIVSTILLLLFIPFLIIVALIIACFDKTNPFFLQKRTGKNGKNFSIIKFKTMKKLPINHQLNEIHNLERLTQLGKFIRKYSIDEIPQLINILKGEMSFIGPRPLLTSYATLYNKEQSKRLLVKPGITGWAQINGRNNLSWNEKFKMDIYYIENISLVLDLKILTLTFIKILKSEGVNQSKEIPMIPFNGNN